MKYGLLYIEFRVAHTWINSTKIEIKWDKNLIVSHLQLWSKILSTNFFLCYTSLSLSYQIHTQSTHKFYSFTIAIKSFPSKNPSHFIFIPPINSSLPSNLSVHFLRDKKSIFMYSFLSWLEMCATCLTKAIFDVVESDNNKELLSKQQRMIDVSWELSLLAYHDRLRHVCTISAQKIIGIFFCFKS